MVRMRTRAGRARGRQPPRRLDAVDVRHPDVHQDHVRIQPAREVDGLAPVLGLADHLEVLARLEDQPEAAADERLVVDEQDADAWRPRRGSARAPRSRRPGAGPAVRCAAEQRGALAHADDAVAGSDGRRALPVVDDVDLQRAAGQAHLDARGRRAGVLERVGERLLHDPVRRPGRRSAAARPARTDSSTPARRSARARRASSRPRARGRERTTRCRRPAGGAARSASRGRSPRSPRAPRAPAQAGCRTRRPAAAAWIVITLTLWPMMSCSSRAIRACSSAAVRCTLACCSRLAPAAQVVAQQPGGGEPREDRHQLPDAEVAVAEQQQRQRGRRRPRRVQRRRPADVGADAVDRDQRAGEREAVVADVGASAAASVIPSTGSGKRRRRAIGSVASSVSSTSPVGAPGGASPGAPSCGSRTE